MSLWSRIADALAALARGESLADVFGRLRTPPERSVAFTIAVIALGAKMAKADGRVTRNEVAAFREVFTIPPEEEANAARVFDLARQDVAGFDLYARRIAAMFPPADPVLEELLDCLFHIAKADGEVGVEELAYLRTVAGIFGFGDDAFERIRAGHIGPDESDPYHVLGVARSASDTEVRDAYRRLARDHHPDRLVAQGMPEEFMKVATEKMARINAAWDAVRSQRGIG